MRESREELREDSDYFFAVAFFGVARIHSNRSTTTPPASATDVISYNIRLFCTAHRVSKTKQLFAIATAFAIES